MKEESFNVLIVIIAYYINMNIGVHEGNKMAIDKYRVCFNVHNIRSGPIAPDQPKHGFI